MVLPAIGTGEEARAEAVVAPSSGPSPSFPPIHDARPQKKINDMVDYLRDELGISESLPLKKAIYEAAAQLEVETEGHTLTEIAKECCDLL